MHRLEYIAQSSPWITDPETEETYVPTGDYATDYAYFWPDADWTAVPGGDAILDEET